jgi:hypothetical protein
VVEERGMQGGAQRGADAPGLDLAVGPPPVSPPKEEGGVKPKKRAKAEPKAEPIRELPPLPIPLQDERMVSLLKLRIKERWESGVPPTETGLQVQLNKLSKCAMRYGIDAAMEWVEAATIGHWTGIIPNNTNDGEPPRRFGAPPGPGGNGHRPPAQSSEPVLTPEQIAARKARTAREDEIRTRYEELWNTHHVRGMLPERHREMQRFELALTGGDEKTMAEMFARFEAPLVPSSPTADQSEAAHG